jgi:hypothetical protein
MRSAEETAEMLYERMRSASQQVVETSDITYRVIQYLGGPDRFAQMLAEEIRDAPSGSVARQRLFDLLGRFMLNAEAQRQSNEPDLDLMTDEELEAYSKQMIKDAVESMMRGE